MTLPHGSDIYCIMVALLVLSQKMQLKKIIQDTVSLFFHASKMNSVSSCATVWHQNTGYVLKSRLTGGDLGCQFKPSPLGCSRGQCTDLSYNSECTFSCCHYADADPPTLKMQPSPLNGICLLMTCSVLSSCITTQDQRESECFFTKCI